MAMSIHTNAAALNSQRTLNASQGSLQTAMQRLSTGLRVNSAKDDAAGLTIADRMNAQARGNTVAIRNANEALGMTQVADNALSKVTEGLQRIRELAVQGSNGTLNTTDYANIQEEHLKIKDELDRLLKGGTKYNNTATNVFAGSVTFQVGANADTTYEQIAVDFSNGGAVTTAVDAVTAIDFTGGRATAEGAIATIDTALEEVGELRTHVGAYQNRFENVISTLQGNVEALTAARGRIMDADFASETANLSRSQVLQQAGTAMLAQANQSAQNVMQLLR